MTLNGYDISAYQGSLNPAAVPGDFVIVKATGGDGYVNPNFRAQVQAARNAGKLVGIYHFARDGYTAATAQSEAAWFIRNAGDLLDGTVLAVLDWEADNQTDVGYAHAWLDTVTAQTGVKPVIYMSFATIKAANWAPVANADYGLWEAAYVLGYQQINGYNPPAGLADIPYWSTRCMWQYTSVGRLPGWGDNLDLDVFYGDASTWAAYCAKNGVIQPASSGGITPEDDMLTDAQAAQLAYLASPQFKIDLWTVADGPEADARAKFEAEITAKVWGYVNAALGTDDAYQILRNAAAPGSVTLTDAQVQELGTDVAAKLPASPTKDDIAAAVLAAIKAQANK
jgi:GH25 family lysozyme M1 (1,4-beta-N-acetylmuramidase)